MPPEDRLAGVEVDEAPEWGTRLRAGAGPWKLLPGRREEKDGVLLTPEAFWFAGLRTPWAAVEAIEARGDKIKVTLDRTQVTGASRVVRAALRASGAIEVPAGTLRADPTAVYAVFRVLQEAPELRHLVADPGGVDGIVELLRSYSPAMLEQALGRGAA